MKTHDSQVNELKTKKTSILKLGEDLKQSDFRYHKLRSETQEVQDSMRQVEKEKKAMRRLHKSEVFELEQKIKELQQDIQVSNQNLSQIRSSYQQLGSCVQSNRDAESFNKGNKSDVSYRDNN